jgi:hypothetical protein
LSSIIAAQPEFPIKQFAGTALRTPTLSADIELTYTNSEGMHRNVGTIRLMKPNHALINQFLKNTNYPGK